MIFGFHIEKYSTFVWLILKSVKNYNNAMQHKVIDTKDVVIRFAGDSGDGMQLTGSLFADMSAIFGN